MPIVDPLLSNTRQSLSDFTTLWRLWLTKPRQIATWAPSSAAVGAAFADAVVGGRDGLVIELGAGTGPVTAALLDRGIARDRLAVVEADPILHARLCRRFGAAGMLCLDARTLAPTIADLLDRRGLDHVGAIVSTLPILHFGAADQRAVLDQCFMHAAPEAGFTQITYMPFSPIRRRRLARWGYAAERWRRVTRNWPPATLWQYRWRFAVVQDRSLD